MGSSEFPDGRILVASAAVEDARLIASLLQEDFSQVRISTDDKLAVADLEAYRPDLLVLAFRTLSEAERYYLGLYRRSEQIHAIPHKTLVLGDRAESFRVFELCRKQHFDDYVMFWPVNHDTYRLRMAAAQALRADRERDTPSARQFASHARRIAALKGVMERQLAEGNEQMHRMAASIRQAEHQVEASIQNFARRFEDGTYSELVDVKDGPRFQGELRRFGMDGVQAPLASMEQALQPVHEWMAGLGDEVGPSLRTAQALAAMAERVAPLVLVVDDDLFQHTMLKRQLDTANVELMFASNATGALSLMRTRRPDLVLLDVNLPDMSGVELLQRLKTASRTRHVPVIMITGTTTRDVVVDSRRAGAVDVMAKPLCPERLISGIERHLSTAAETGYEEATE